MNRSKFWWILSGLAILTLVYYCNTYLCDGVAIPERCGSLPWEKVREY